MRREARRHRAIALVLVTVLTVLSGCSAAPEPATVSNAGGSGGDPEDGFILNILIIDQELVPIDQALVTLTPGPQSTNTSTDGRASFGPLVEGDYTVRVEKDGYATIGKQVFIAQSPPDRLIVSLVPVASDVPYHLTHVFVAYIFCTMTISNTFAPCVPVNVLTGQNITEDRAEFNFQIPYPGLADMLHEMVWQRQPTGVDMSVTIRPPGAPLVVGGVTVTYLSTGGGSPLRNWVVAGVENEGASAPFDANESTPYTTIIRGNSDNTTGNLMSLYLDHRVNNYFTFFYNRPGPRDFTVIPEE